MKSSDDCEAVMARGPGGGIDLSLGKGLLPEADRQREIFEEPPPWRGC